MLTKVLPAIQSGDLAIARAQLAALRERYPDAKITLMCRCPSQDAHWFPEADTVMPELFPMVGESFPKRAARFVRILLGLGDDEISSGFRRTLDGANLLLFCGGGSPGGYGFGNLLLNAWCPAKMAERVGVPIVFTGLGVQSPKGRWHRMLQANVFRKANAIAARDPLSFETLETYRTDARIECTADWAWLLPAEGQKKSLSLLANEGVTQSRRPRIGINLRNASAVGPDGKTNEDSSKTGMVILNALVSAADQLDAELYLFSMNRPPASDDLEYARGLLAKNESNRIRLIMGEYSPSELKGMIATMDIFLGTRLHPSLFAVSSGVPVVTVHEQDKVRGFMQQIGMLQWHLPAVQLEADAVEKKVLELFASCDHIGQHLKEKAPGMQMAAQRNLDCIAAFVSQGVRENPA